MDESKLHLVPPPPEANEVAERQKWLARAERLFSENTAVRAAKVARLTGLPPEQVTPYIVAISLEGVGLSAEEARLVDNALLGTEIEIIYGGDRSLDEVNELEEVRSGPNDLQMTLGESYPSVDFVHLKEGVSVVRTCALAYKYLRDGKEPGTELRTVFVKELLFTLEQSGLVKQELLMLLTADARRDWEAELARRKQKYEADRPWIAQAIKDSFAESREKVTGEPKLVEHIQSQQTQRMLGITGPLIAGIHEAAASIDTLLLKYPDVRILFDKLMGVVNGKLPL
jgi:hypothetical protein